MAKQAKAVSNTDDSELILLAVEKIRKIDARITEVSELRGDDDEMGYSETYKKSELSHLYDQLETFRAVFAAVRANSLSDVLGQVEEVSRIFDDLEGIVMSEEESGKNYRALKRLLHSINSALRQSVSTDLGAVFNYMEPHLDPWLGFQHRIDFIVKRKEL